MNEQPNIVHFDDAPGGAAAGSDCPSGARAGHGVRVQVNAMPPAEACTMAHARVHAMPPAAACTMSPAPDWGLNPGTPGMAGSPPASMAGAERAGAAVKRAGPDATPIVFGDEAPAGGGGKAGAADTASAKPRAARGATAITFDDPSPTPARTRVTHATPAILASDPDSPEVRLAIEQARRNGGEAWQASPIAVEGAIRQLLPFRLEVLVRWGDSALQDNGRLVAEAGDLQRTQSALGVNEIIQQALDSHSTHKGLLERLRGPAKVDLDALRVRAAGISTALAQMAPRVEALRRRVREQAARLGVLVAALSSAASVGSARLDAPVDTALQNRRVVLAQASQQAALLLPQIDEMRRQLADQEARLVQFVNITLPAMLLAEAQGGRR